MSRSRNGTDYGLATGAPGRWWRAVGDRPGRHPTRSRQPVDHARLHGRCRKYAWEGLGQDHRRTEDMAANGVIDSHASDWCLNAHGSLILKCVVSSYRSQAPRSQDTACPRRPPEQEGLRRHSLPDGRLRESPNTWSRLKSRIFLDYREACVLWRLATSCQRQVLLSQAPRARDHSTTWKESS